MKHRCHYGLLIFTGLTAVLLNSCSANSPDDANFKSAIEAALNSSSSRSSDNCVSFDLSARTDKAYQQDTFLQILISQGYITATKVPDLNDYHYSGETPRPGYTLKLTEKGTKAFRDDYFCYGKITVTKIDNYTLGTIPGTGEKFASVKYEYQVEGKPDWLSTDLVTWQYGSANPIKLTLKTQNGEMDLTQGEKGWYRQ